MGITNLEYTPALSTPVHKTNGEENKSFTSLMLPVLSFTIFIIFVSWCVFPGSWVLKCIVVANLLVYYSWELVYFDSLKPGVEPSSPLSPPHIRMKSGFIFHFNYTLATLIGICVTLFVGCLI